MVQTAEIDKTYFIPEDTKQATDSKWVQTQKIPVTYKELQIGPTTYIYLRFVIGDNPSPLDILAGDPGNVEFASSRIIAQMTHRLEHALVALQTPTPYPVASLEAEQIGKYFTMIH